jgi:hypothetical protein
VRISPLQTIPIADYIPTRRQYNLTEWLAARIIFRDCCKTTLLIGCIRNTKLGLIRGPTSDLVP